MKVEVFSLTAAVVGTEQGTTWQGEIPDELFGNSTTQRSFEVVYRLLNRVDESDVKRLEDWGYNLPSLSVGDYVTIYYTTKETTRPKGITKQVANIGFNDITGNHDLLFIKNA